LNGLLRLRCLSELTDHGLVLQTCLGVESRHRQQESGTEQDEKRVSYGDAPSIRRCADTFRR
jgi:hypothetical protein